MAQATTIKEQAGKQLVTATSKVRRRGRETEGHIHSGVGKAMDAVRGGINDDKISRTPRRERRADTTNRTSGKRAATVASREKERARGRLSFTQLAASART